jgi:hypothetical protein
MCTVASTPTMAPDLVAVHAESNPVSRVVMVAGHDRGSLLSVPSKRWQLNLERPAFYRACPGPPVRRCSGCGNSLCGPLPYNAAVIRGLARPTGSHHDPASELSR